MRLIKAHPKGIELSTRPSHMTSVLALLATAGMAITSASVALGSSAADSQAARNARIVLSQVTKNGDRQRIVSVRADGSGLIRLSNPGKGLRDIDATVSPDGSQVMYERDADEDPSTGGPQPHFFLVDSGGGNERMLDLGCTDPCAADTGATWTPIAGRIAYSRVVGPFDGPGDSARSAVLWTSNLDGSDRQRLSEPGIDGTYEDYFARYSPDGTYIVFTRVRNKPFNSAVFRMNPDGTGTRRLTPWKIDADLADLSPATSGRTRGLIVFETFGHGAPKGKTQNVATVPANCASLRKCTKRIRFLTHLRRGPGARFNPTWSPNGKRIAYTKFRGDGKECCVGDIYKMRPDGTHRRAVLTSKLFEFRPDWGTTP